MSPVSEKKKTYQVMKISVDQVKTDLGIDSDEKLADLLGYHATAISSWRKAGAVPKVVSVVIEGLKRRRRQSTPDDLVVVLSLISRSKADILMSVSKPLGATSQLIELPR